MFDNIIRDMYVERTEYQGEIRTSYCVSLRDNYRFGDGKRTFAAETVPELIAGLESIVKVYNVAGKDGE